jgi:hypothetical protein
MMECANAHWSLLEPALLVFTLLPIPRQADARKINNIVNYRF